MPHFSKYMLTLPRKMNKMSSLVTQRNSNSVEAFLYAISDEQKRADAFKFLELFKNTTGFEPEMWGESIIGFGSYHYVYASGREGDWMLTGFSPRAKNFSLYIMSGFSRFDSLLAELGKHKTGKACLYVNKWDDVNAEALEEMIRASVAFMKEKYNG